MALLAILALASFASAQAAAAPSANAAAKHIALVDLRQAHKLLAEADHDYDGHRARAAEEVHKAIHELEGKYHGAKVNAVPVPGIVMPAKVNQPALSEPQPVSDAQLLQALQLLQAAVPDIKANHPKALANVLAAIQEITIALKIK